MRNPATAAQAAHARTPHHQPDLAQLHAQAVTALSAALRLVTSPSIEPDGAAFSKALSRAMRATTALKRACSVIGKPGV